MSNFVKYKDVIYMHCFGTSDAYNLSAIKDVSVLMVQN